METKQVVYLLSRSDDDSFKIWPPVHQCLQLEWIPLVHMEDGPINLERQPKEDRVTVSPLGKVTKSVNKHLLYDSHCAKLEI